MGDVRKLNWYHLLLLAHVSEILPVRVICNLHHVLKLYFLVVLISATPRVMGPKIVSLYKGSPVETPLKSTTIAAKKSRKHTSGLPGSDSIWKTSSDPQSQVQGPYETLADGHELLQSRTKEGGIGMDEGLSRHELNDSFPLAE